MGVVLTFGEHVDTPLCGGRGGLLPPRSATDNGKALSLKQANAKAFPHKATADILIHRLRRSPFPHLGKAYVGALFAQKALCHADRRGRRSLRFADSRIVRALLSAPCEWALTSSATRSLTLVSLGHGGPTNVGGGVVSSTLLHKTQKTEDVKHPLFSVS